MPRLQRVSVESLIILEGVGMTFANYTPADD